MQRKEKKVYGDKMSVYCTLCDVEDDKNRYYVHSIAGVDFIFEVVEKREKFDRNILLADWELIRRYVEHIKDGTWTVDGDGEIVCRDGTDEQCIHTIRRDGEYITINGCGTSKVPISVIEELIRKLDRRLEE